MGTKPMITNEYVNYWVFTRGFNHQTWDDNDDENVT